MFRVAWNSRKKINDTRAFTITEVLFVAVIMAMVIGTILSIWIFTNRIWVKKNEETMLRMDLMKAMETIRHDMRLSSLTDMAFFPKGATSYTAVSLPVAEPDADGLLTIDSGGKIEWDKTVIYHVYTAPEGEKTLRRTVYDPRDNDLSEDDLYTQLVNTVKDGKGSSGSTTDLDFVENIEEFDLSSSASVFDFYGDYSDSTRVGKVMFGWLKIAPGQHKIRFEITGKNDLSSGYDIGIDNIMIEPSGSEREVEYYSSSFAPSGAFTVSGGSVNKVHDDIWANSNFIEYQPSTIGNYIEIEDGYDLWRESSFATVSLNNAELIEDDVRASLALPQEEDEGEYAWFAYIAAGDTVQEGVDIDFDDVFKYTSDPSFKLRRIAMRILLDDEDIHMSGEETDPERAFCRIRLKSATANPLTVDRIYITKRNGTTGYNGLKNTAPAAGQSPSEYHFHQQLFFRDPSTGNVTPSITMAANSEVWTLWSAFPINSNDDYFVTLAMTNVEDLKTKYWKGGSAVRTYYMTRENTVSCTADSVTDTFNAVLHGKADGRFVAISGSVLPGGLAETGIMVRIAGTPDWQGMTRYYVVNSSANSFQLSMVPGGPPVDITSNGWGLSYSEVKDVTDSPGPGIPEICVAVNVDTWDSYGSVESQVFDTMMSSPVYDELKYSENRPSGTNISFKTRSSGNSDMSGASLWEDITGSASNPTGLSMGSARYVQFMGEFSTQPYWEEESSGSVLTYPQYVNAQLALGGTYDFPAVWGRNYIMKAETPWVDDVEIDWPGQETICALAGYVAKKNNYGQAKITVDGNALLKALAIHFKVSANVDEKVVSEEGYMEIEPRNTGK